MMMKKELVSTILGDIQAIEMGFCHSHEHLFIKKGQPELLDSSLLLDDYYKTKSEVEYFKSMGGQTIVDAQPIGSGRDARNLMKLAEETSIHIVSSTGFHKNAFYPKGHWISTASVNKLAELFIEEIEVGLFADGEDDWPIDKLAGKAGVIKTAADVEGPTGLYTHLFQAAAEASKQTGTPIMSHTELGYGALEQVDFYRNLDIPEDQLIMCHLDRKKERISNLLRVADKGVFLELDTIGRFKYHSDEDEVRLICNLIDYGHEDQLLLGLDTTRARMKSYGGKIGLSHIKMNFIPLLMEAGITEEQIHKMMYENPAKAFSKQ